MIIFILLPSSKTNQRHLAALFQIAMPQPRVPRKASLRNIRFSVQYRYTDIFSRAALLLNSTKIFHLMSIG